MCIKADQSAVCAINRHLLLCQASIGGWSLALIHLANAAALFLPVLPTLLRGYCCAVRQNERQLPSGSGETKGVLLLRSQAERKAASAPHTGELKGERAPLDFSLSNEA